MSVKGTTSYSAYISGDLEVNHFKAYLTLSGSAVNNSIFPYRLLELVFVMESHTGYPNISRAIALHCYALNWATASFG